MLQERQVTSVRTFGEFDQWLGHTVQGKASPALARPTWKMQDGTAPQACQEYPWSRPFPMITGRVEAPIYPGRITPAKWFIRGWQHHREPLFFLNDIAIRKVDQSRESMLTQFLETDEKQSIRWDLNSRRSGTGRSCRDHPVLAT